MTSRMLGILSEHHEPDKQIGGIETLSQRNPSLKRRSPLYGSAPSCDPRPVTIRSVYGNTPPRTRVVLDEVSKAIIEELQHDGRRSYAAIGKVVGLSEAAVRQRVQRLVESGVMQVVAVTDPLELGFARQAMIGIRASGSLEPIADALAALPEVDYVVITAGSFDVLVEVVCESDDELLSVLSSKIRTIDNVVSTETFMYLQLRKQTYSWGVR
jgi:Lrp/AsnC family transcriptional regulator for asnA, asnC and gidA